MTRKRIAIACQGGGSQCAFIAGALKTLFARGVQERFEIVGFSGTSGGALTAGVAWYGLLKRAQGDRTPPEDRVIALWNDLTAQTPQEIAFDMASIQTVRLTERGVLPSFATSPSSPQFQAMTKAVAKMLGRPEFTDLRALIVKHIDFDALPALMEPGSPILLAGAADVIEGHLQAVQLGAAARSSRRRCSRPPRSRTCFRRCGSTATPTGTASSLRTRQSPAFCARPSWAST